VVQIVSDIGETLTVDMSAIEPIRVSAEFDPTETWMEFEAGSPGQGLGLEVHDRKVAYERFRMQRLLLRVSAEVIAPFDKPWLFPDALRIVQRVVEEKVEYGAGVDPRELCNQRYMEQLRQRISDSIRPEAGSKDRLLPVLDSYDPIGSTDRIAFVTAKPCEPTVKSHIWHVAADSNLEVQIAHELEQDARVLAYAKNDRLFLEIPYRYLGRTLRYRPDFLVKVGESEMLLIEGKGKADEKDDAKATAARRWVAAGNSWGKLGHWGHAICYKRTEVQPAVNAALAASRDLA
jgi:type III restriction enzyme